MATLDFLFQGSPPPSTTTYGTTTTGIPQFMQDYTIGLLGKANAVAAEPYTPYGGPRVADFTGAQQQAFGQTQAMQGQWTPQLQQAQGYTANAGAQNPLAYAAPYMGAATSFSATQAANPWLGAAGAQNPIGMSQPYAAAAGQTFTGQNVANYMNPYTDQVVNRVGDLAARQLNEKLMPAINDDFIRAGQYGSSRMQEITGRALRDTQESALAQQGSLLNQGYTQAGQLFGQDASRMAGLAGQQGQLGLGYMGALGQLGSTAGSLANSEMGQYGNLAQLAGNLGNAYASNQLATGQQMGNLGQLGQTLGLRDTAALEAVGTTQQNLNQKNLDVAYQDYLNQLYYPQQQLGFMSNMLRGVPSQQIQTSANAGPANVYQPSGLSQIAGALSLYSALNKT